MSTDYVTSERIPFAQLFDGRLEKFKVYEDIGDGGTSSETKRCLTDGRNYLWLYATDDFLGCMSRYGGNSPGRILKAIAETFDVDIFSEYEPQFWGFDTQADWDAAMEEMNKESQERFYVEILKYLRGEPVDYFPDSIGMSKLEIAKALVAEDPELLLATNKDRLLNAIDEHDNRPVVRLTEADVAFVQMAMADDDDLPSA